MEKILITISLFLPLFSQAQESVLQSIGMAMEQNTLIELQNPIIPGHFADPSIVEHEGTFYIYATSDPWGGDSLACWMSEDFRHWTLNRLNWPTKEACTSPASNTNKVWAPSVVKKGDAFYMYVSVGSEVWCGKASHPLGPWENMLGNKPMIPYDTTRYYHVIDAEAFLDDDGRAYLYWGSGWEWINGHCFAAELNEDMSSFKSAPIEVTPSHYFEGPFMTKHQGKYYLSYSDGKTIEDTYKVRYAVGNSPFGPFKEADNSPILQTTDSLQVYGPGHHAIFTFRDKNYILYHRHSLPFVSGTAMRQICINGLVYDDARSQIKTIIPYSGQLFPDLDKKREIEQALKACETALAERFAPGQDSVRLVGVMTVQMENDGDKARMMQLAELMEGKKERDNIFFAADGSFYRFYFPLADAIVDHDGKRLFADNTGIVSLNGVADANKLKVIGRKKSPTVQGTSNDIITDDAILFKSELLQERDVRSGNNVAILIFPINAWNM